MPLGNPETPFLSEYEIAKLDHEELQAYIEALSEYERTLDLEDVAHGLTLSLEQFERQAWNIVEPDTPLQWNWHYDYLCEWLTLISTGEFKQIYPDKLGLIINVPPRSGKSTFGTVNWPCWDWLTHPARRFVIGSYNADLSQSHNQKRNFLIQSGWFQERFSDRFHLTAKSSGETANDRTGRFQTAGITTSKTGRGGMILIGDDLLDRQKAFSKRVKAATNNWIDSSFSKMLDDQVRGVTVHISQRLAVDDPTGHLLGEDIALEDPEKAAQLRSQWIQIKIRREATEAEEYIFPKSGHKHSRPKGDILQGESRCPAMVVVRLKADSRGWANQEQQEPTPDSGALLNPNWIQWYGASDPLPSFFQVVVSVDCNFKEAKDSDLVALHKYAIAFGRRVLLDRRAEVLSFAATKQAIKEMSQGGHRVSWLNGPMPPATQVLIEDKANGPAIIQQLRSDPNFPLGVIEYSPNKGSKTERFVAATADCEAGLVWMPEDAPWMGELRRTLCDYAGEGSVRYDDDCDAFSQLINWSRLGQYGVLAHLQKMSQPGAQEQVVRCEYVDENGVKLFLVWDGQRGVWEHPETGRTFAAGKRAVETADAAAGATGEAATAIPEGT